MSKQNVLEKSYLALVEFILLSKRTIAQVAEKYKVSPIQAITLLLLNETRPMHSFTSMYNCDASNTSGIIDGLVKKDLVKRYELESDRRVKMVELKPKGSAVRKDIISKLTGDESFITNKLSDEELLSFIGLVQKIVS